MSAPRMTEQELADYEKRTGIKVMIPKVPVKKKPNKYNARKTKADNIVFDSIDEAARYGELKLLQRVGEIRDLVVKPRWDLKNEHIAIRFGESGQMAVYTADFMYTVVATGEEVIEDVKGMMTAGFRIAVFESITGLKVNIVRKDRSTVRPASKEKQADANG